VWLAVSVFGPVRVTRIAQPPALDVSCPRVYRLRKLVSRRRLGKATAAPGGGRSQRGWPEQTGWGGSYELWGDLSEWFVERQPRRRPSARVTR